MSNQFQVYEQKRKKNNKSKIRENSKLTCFYSFEKVKIRVCLCIMLCVNKLVFVYFSFFFIIFFYCIYFFIKKTFLFLSKTKQDRKKLNINRLNDNNQPLSKQNFNLCLVNFNINVG